MVEKYIVRQLPSLVVFQRLDFEKQYSDVNRIISILITEVNKQKLEKEGRSEVKHKHNQ